jgi:heat shock protein HslJ
MKKAWLWCCMLVLAAACGSLQKKEPPPKPFAATHWVVVLERPLPGEAPWFVFGDGHMDGFGGCNKVGARYVQDSVGARYLSIGRLEMGRHACDPQSQAAESRILETLQGVSSYTITADTMKMSGSAGTLTLRAEEEKKP